MSSRFYLPLRHDVIAKLVYESVRKKQQPEVAITYEGNEFIHKHNHMEYWWNLSIRTSSKVPHNRPDIVIWDHNVKQCQIVEVSCPCDTNVTKKIKEKEDAYASYATDVSRL